jgi:hypothetical protein
LPIVAAPPTPETGPLLRSRNGYLSKTRIVVVGVHRMTAELIREVYAGQPSTLVERVLTRRVPLVTIAAEHQPDLLITRVEDESLADLDALLKQCPKLTVLAVEADGRRSFLYRLKPHLERLGELSPQTLLAAAREVVPAGS